MISLPYFEEKAFDKLKNSVADNESKYYTDPNWLPAFFQGEDYISESSIKIPEVSLIYSKDATDAQKNEQDYINAKNIYELFKDIMTPQLATNKYMWTALAHTTFAEYVMTRWNGGDIKDRFFCTGGRQSLLYYNAISRLWWAAHLTYDKSYGYDLTKVLFESGQQTYKDLTDCTYSMNRKICRGIILAIRDIKKNDTLANFGDCFRDLNKYLNRYGAVSALDFLDECTIKKLAFDYMCRWQKENNRNWVELEEEPDDIPGNDEGAEITQTVDIVTFLTERGAKCNDGRESGGNLWVRPRPDVDEIIEECERIYNVKFSKGKSFWRLM